MSALRRDVPESAVIEDPSGVACKHEILALKFRGGGRIWYDNRKESLMGLVLLILLIVLLVGVLPKWGYSRNWGYGPARGIGVALAILLLLSIFNVISF